MAQGTRQTEACKVVGITARTLQRWKKRGELGDDERRGSQQKPNNALTEPERQEVLRVVNGPEYRNLSPNQIVPKLADRGKYLCSESTVYRILRKEGQMSHRQASKVPQRRPKASHVADGPNEVWSWDITYLPTVVRGIFFYLYMAVDIWSRKIVGYAVHAEEKMELGALFVERTCQEMQVDPWGIVWHSDNGGPMKGVTMIAKLEELGLIASFSRPRVSDDNPYSEALFRTLKYRPSYPSKPFASLEEARSWVEQFVAWYNTIHQHSAIRFVTPDDRHYGREASILEHRKEVYEQARKQHPERWPSHTRNWDPVGAVYLNPDKKQTLAVAA